MSAQSRCRASLASQTLVHRIYEALARETIWEYGMYGSMRVWTPVDVRVWEYEGMETGGCEGMGV